ncbi:MAG: GC-type dockerin domain-anchored protein [Planctomycetota bacterium]
MKRTLANLLARTLVAGSIAGLAGAGQAQKFSYVGHSETSDIAVAGSFSGSDLDINGLLENNGLFEVPDFKGIIGGDYSWINYNLGHVESFEFDLGNFDFDASVEVDEADLINGNEVRAELSLTIGQINGQNMFASFGEGQVATDTHNVDGFGPVIVSQQASSALPGSGSIGFAFRTEPNSRLGLSAGTFLLLLYGTRPIATPADFSASGPFNGPSNGPAAIFVTDNPTGGTGWVSTELVIQSFSMQANTDGTQLVQATLGSLTGGDTVTMQIDALPVNGSFVQDGADYNEGAPLVTLDPADVSVTYNSVPLAVSSANAAIGQPDQDCPADTNGDGQVTPADFNAWVLAFNSGAPECDQNGDGQCTPADFNAWILNFNVGC